MLTLPSAERSNVTLEMYLEVKRPLNIYQTEVFAFMGRGESEGGVVRKNSMRQ